MAAFLPPSYLRLANSSFLEKEKSILPLWAYTACGFYGGKLYATAIRIDKKTRQLPHFYKDTKLLTKKVTKTLSLFPNNRLYKHLAHCALNYNCLAAKNLFLNRWEAPLVTSNICNSKCLGCLSLRIDLVNRPVGQPQLKGRSAVTSKQPAFRCNDRAANARPPLVFDEDVSECLGLKIKAAHIQHNALKTLDECLLFQPGLNA